MPTNYPTSLDTLPNPTSTTYLDDAGFELDVMVSNLGDAIQALEAKVGVGSSAQSALASRVLGADGTGSSSWRQIATGDLAANAVTQLGTLASLSGSTTSTSYVDITGGSVTLTTTGGDLLAFCTLSSANDTAAKATFLGLRIDSGSEVLGHAVIAPTGGYQTTLAAVWRFTGVSSASHTVTARWKVDSGSTATVYSGQLLVMEVKK